MVKKIVECSFRLPDKMRGRELDKLVKQVLDTYMPDVGDGNTYELIAYPDAHSLRLRSPGRLPASIADRRYDPTLKLSTTYCAEAAGYLLEKGTKPNV